MRRQIPHVRFNVAEVSGGTKALPVCPLGKSLERVSRSRLFACSNWGQSVVANVGFHPLIAAAALAYQEHYPLVLSPDMIWLTVLQGVAQHVQNHSEHLRARLVKHEGKLELSVDAADIQRRSAEMAAVLKEFRIQIVRHMHAGKRGLFEARFSTTTETEEIAAGVVIMDAFEPYFEYVVKVSCGIPTVILEGTAADWKVVEEKVEDLHESDLELAWWTGQLLPLCRHFVRAATGDVDQAHWGDLCKVTKLYAANDLNGWLLNFIPYVKASDGRLTDLNPLFAPGALKRRSRLRKKATGCTSNILPNGVSSVPVKFRFPKMRLTKRGRFLAGFTGLEQWPNDLALRPVIGWAIADLESGESLQVQSRDGTADFFPLRDGRFHRIRPGRICDLVSATDGQILVSEALASLLRETCGDCLDLRRTELVQVATGETFGAYWVVSDRKHLTARELDDARDASCYAWCSQGNLYVSAGLGERIRQRGLDLLLERAGAFNWGA